MASRDIRSSRRAAFCFLCSFVKRDTPDDDLCCNALNELAKDRLGRSKIAPSIEDERRFDTRSAMFRTSNALEARMHKANRR